MKEGFVRKKKGFSRRQRGRRGEQEGGDQLHKHVKLSNKNPKCNVYKNGSGKKTKKTQRR